MIKRILFLLIGLQIVIGCKHQKEDKPLGRKSDDNKKSEYLLDKNNRSKTFDFSDIKGKWELSKSSYTDNSKTYHFELLNDEFILDEGTCDVYFKIDNVHNLEYHLEGHFYNHSLKDRKSVV